MRNAAIIAEQINSSSKNVKAFWFFTVHSLSDEPLLNLLASDKHEIGLHIVNDPFRELDVLEAYRKRLDRGLDVEGCRSCNQRNPYWRELFEKYVW